MTWITLRRSTWLHLRLPFSFFLLPVFLWASAIVYPLPWENALLAAFILHFLLYPASNGFNSYFDKDEDSIGGLEHPPEVSRQLYHTANLLDGAALILGSFISLPFVLCLLIYSLVSRAYSHPLVRLKKYPILSWLVAGFFQGCFTVWMSWAALQPEQFWAMLDNPVFWQASLLSSAMLWAAYPMTQIYQHKEDERRGDLTLSRLLGIRGTFGFTLFFYILAHLAYTYFIYIYFSPGWALFYQLFLLPVMLFFLWWMKKSWKDQQQVNFKGSMRLNLYSALALNAFFLALLLWQWIG